MDEPLDTALAHLSRELSADPCRIDLLIERIILCALGRDLAAARSDLSTVQRLGAALGLAPALSLVACGRYWALAERGLYVLFDPSVGAGLAGAVFCSLRRTREAADRYFGPSTCRMVVELASNAAESPYHATFEAPGIGYFKLSPPTSPDVYLHLIAHEVAHLYLTSRNRFLDEGIALLFQRHCLGSPLLLGSETALDSSPAIARNVPYSLRALLAHDGSRDAGFAGFTSSSSDSGPPLHVFALASRLAAYLIDRLQLAGLQSLCASLRVAGRCAAHPAIVSASIGEDIETLDERLLAREIASPPDTLSGCGFTHPSTTPIWADLSASALDTLILQLRHTLPRVRFRSGVKAALARAIVRRALDRRAETLIPDIAELQSLVHELRADGGLAERELTLLEGWLAVTEAIAAPNAIMRIVGWERAIASFRSALARFDGDGEVLCAAAAINLRGPVELGADRALARVCLAKARTLPGWDNVARRLERDMEGGALAAGDIGPGN